jgi:hypothetical protein
MLRQICLVRWFADSHKQRKNLQITSLCHTENVPLQGIVKYTHHNTKNLFRSLWIFRCNSVEVEFNASPTEGQNCFFFSRFLSCMWLLPQNSCRVACKHLLSFLYRNLPSCNLCSCTAGTGRYTDFSSLVDSTAERKHGASLHRQRKCSQADCLWASSSSFPLGPLSFMLPEAPQPYGLLYYPRIGLSNFIHQFRAATPPKQRKPKL